ncbi:MAG: AsmA-like C-terminal region-containing protein [Candidatus Omnitrophica bacterium]|nr:AsmA-like C-terminal region-containing protein [Candidatus Omnitrophota bacterium]
MKKLLLAAIITLSLIIAATYALNTFLPEKIKQISENYLRKTFAQEAAIAKVTISPFRGVLFENVVCYDKATKKPFLKAARVQAVPLLPSLLTKKKVILYLSAEDAYYNLKRDDHGHIRIATQVFKVRGNDFLINNIRVKNLALDFDDRITGFHKIFDGIDIGARFMIPSDVNYRLTWSKKITLKGAYNLKNETLKASLVLKDINLNAIAPYLNNFTQSEKTAGAPKGNLLTGFIFDGGYIRWAEFEILAKDGYHARFTADIEKLSAKYSFKDTDANATQNIEAKGNLAIDMGEINYVQGAPVYRLNCRLQKGEFKNIAFLDTFSNTNATFSLDEKSLQIFSLQTAIKDTIIKARGQVDDFSEPKLYLTGDCSSNMAQMAALCGRLGYFKPPQIAKGGLEIQFTLRGNIAQKAFDYALAYRINDAQIDGFENIGGAGRIENDTLFWDGSLQYKKVPMVVKGRIERLSSLGNAEETGIKKLPPVLYLEGEFHSSLAQAIAAAKYAKFLYFDYAGPGFIDLKFIINGNLGEKNYRYSANYALQGAEFKDLKRISARGQTRSGGFTVTEGAFVYKDIPFVLRGTLEDFRAPRINLTVENEIFSAIAKAFYKAGRLTVEQAIIKGKETKLSVRGRIIESNKISVAMQGEGDLSFEDAQRAFSAFGIPMAILEKARPRATFNTTFLLSGTGNPKTWLFKLSGYSDKLKIYGLEAQNANLLLEKKQNELIISPLSADLCQGKVDFRAKIDFSNKETIYNLIANDVDLSRLGEQLKLKNKNLSGKLSLEGEAKNNSLSDFHALTGQGKVIIKEGNIWEINFLKGLGNLLFIPDFEEIQFKEGSSDFVFKNSTIIFDNLKLHALEMDLEGAGKITFDGNIHFMLIPRFNPDLISVSEGLKKITTSVLGKSGLLIEIEGTLKEPRYQMKPLILSPWQKIKEFFRELEA